MSHLDVHVSAYGNCQTSAWLSLNLEQFFEMHKLNKTGCEEQSVLLEWQKKPSVHNCSKHLVIFKTSVHYRLVKNQDYLLNRELKQYRSFCGEIDDKFPHEQTDNKSFQQ